MGGVNKRARRTAKRFEHDPEFYAVDPKKDFPQETYCMNVMCRAKFWREFGENEFCPACRKMLKPRSGDAPKGPGKDIR